MIAHIGLIPTNSFSNQDRIMTETMGCIASHCRTLAQSHLDLAEKAERLLDQFLFNRRFRIGLRTFARHHRRAAWRCLEMSRQAEAAPRLGFDDFDLADILSS